MTEQEAINFALEGLRVQGTSVGSRPVYAIRKERHMRLGKNRSGWLVVVPLAVPDSFDPNAIHVEVYDPDGEIYIPIVI